MVDDSSMREGPSQRKYCPDSSITIHPKYLVSVVQLNAWTDDRDALRGIVQEV